MANKRYDQFTAGSYDENKIFLIADPATGELVKIALSQVPTIFSQDGALASNRSVNLNENFLHITGIDDAIVARFTDTEINLIATWHPLVDSYTSLELNASDENSRFKLEAQFNGGDIVRIDGNTSDGSINHTATVHAFTIPEVDGQFNIFNGSESLFVINTTHGRIEANDGVRQSMVRVEVEDGGDTTFLIMSQSGGTTVSIEGDPDDGNIVYTSVNHIFNTSFGTQISLQPDLSIFKAVNSTLDGNEAIFSGNTGDDFAQAVMTAFFNDGIEEARIEILANAFGNNITHTADSHTINGTVSVNTNGQQTVEIASNLQSSYRAADGTALTEIRVRGDSADPSVDFTLSSTNSVKYVEILGSGETGIITHTADTHVSNIASSWTVTDGSNDYVTTNKLGTSIQSNDGTASGTIRTKSELGDNDVKFTINSDDGTSNPVSIVGDGQASSITHTADTHIFNIDGVLSKLEVVETGLGGQPLLSVGRNNSFILAFDPTDDDNLSGIDFTVSPTDVIFSIVANFNDNVKRAEILGEADSVSANLSFFADESNFNGDLILADLAGGGLTGASIDNNGKIVRT